MPLKRKTQTGLKFYSQLLIHILLLSFTCLATSTNHNDQRDMYVQAFLIKGFS